MTLAEFLRVRILEDEDTAYRARAKKRRPWSRVTVDPERLLADCSARRRILSMAVDALAAADNPPDEPVQRAFNSGAATAAMRALKAEAAVYGSHPDYNPEWKP